MNTLIIFALGFVPVVLGQTQFYGCDFYQPLELNRWYDVFSPQFPENYPPNSMCRWTGCAPYGSNILVNCTTMQLPATPYCNGDRLEISYYGCQDLNDASRYCSDSPFLGVTKLNAIVIALKGGAMGGRFFCQIQARPAAIQGVHGGFRYPLSQELFPTSPNTIVTQPASYQPVQQQQTSYQPVQQQQPSYQPVQQTIYQPPSYQQGYQSSQGTYQPHYQYPAQSYQPSQQGLQSVQQGNRQWQQGYQPAQQGYRPAYQTIQGRPVYQPIPAGYQPVYQQPSQPVYQPMGPPTQPQPPCQCGLRKMPRIVGGIKTDVNEFPFVCGIMDMNTKRVICGCTIIHESYVLTAAHCIVNQTLADLGCLVGNQDYTKPAESPYTAIYRFAGFIPYPNYDAVSFINDIAIMRVIGAFQFNPGVSPVCLPLSPRLNENSFVYSRVEAVGWGEISFGGPASTTLQKVLLTVIPNNECNNNFPYQISSAQICTFTPMSDTCEFDDGGPLIFTDTLTGRAVLTGVISYGMACASRVPRVCTRATSYMSWVQETTNVTFCII